MQTVLFRSATQQRVLAVLYLEGDDDHPWTIRQLAHRVGASEAAVSREVSRLCASGPATEERAGNRRLIRPVTNGAIAHHLAGLLRASFGPEVVLRRLLADRDDVQQALIFGSYAARAWGEPGPLPREIEVLLIGDIDPQDAYDLAHQGTLETGVEITPVIRTVEEWNSDDSGFAMSVRQRPTIDLLA